MENLSQNKKISLGLGVIILISLFLTWVDYFIFSTSLIRMPCTLSDFYIDIGDYPFKLLLAIYTGYVFFILGVAGLFFNYKGDINKSKLAYYAMFGYFLLVIILNISGMSDAVDGMGGGDDGKSIFRYLGMGVYIFIASFIGNLKFLKEENNPEVID